MRGHRSNETGELATADLLVTVSYEDKIKLEERGLKNVHWSPPCVAEHCFDDSSSVAVVGSGNVHNVEGIKWLQHATMRRKKKIHCYGAVSKYVLDDGGFMAHGSYKNNYDPFEECGIFLMLTKGGTGIQIKGIEALACGRAIIARKGGMRDLPRENIGWVEVDTPDEMMEKLYELESDTRLRQRIMRMARSYYHLYLEQNDVLSKLKLKYCEIVK